MKAARETVKMKTSEGEVKMAVLGDNPGPEEYLQHLNSFLRMLSRKKWDDEMTKLTEAVLVATAQVRKLVKRQSPRWLSGSLGGIQRKKSSIRPKPRNLLRWGWSTTVRIAG